MISLRLKRTTLDYCADNKFAKKSLLKASKTAEVLSPLLISESAS